MPPTIRKAVIPAAGIGSRLLPLTKAIPKEMLPVGDKPVIEHTVRELVSSGITDITIVVSGGKSLIQEHFRPNPGLVEQLRADGKDAYADAVEEVAQLLLGSAHSLKDALRMRVQDLACRRQPHTSSQAVHQLGDVGPHAGDSRGQLAERERLRGRGQLAEDAVFGHG